MTQKIAFQGESGSNSHIACVEARPDYEPLACRTFEDAFAAVEKGEADLAMIPVENTIVGRVGDIHHLLPTTKLHMVAEHFMAIRFQLMGLKGTKLEDIKRVFSHVMALGQCRKFLREHGIIAVTSADTAGAARQVAHRRDPSAGAIAPAMAAEIYGLDVLALSIEDETHNMTRFVIMAREPADIEAGSGPTVTAIHFEVRNIPAALYKVMGGFATNGVNMTKLESYQIGGSFSATQFYAEVEGHPEERNLQLALEELAFFSDSLKVLGVYPAAKTRGRRVS
ncbi:MAG: prephenate dehydratase [Hyphomonadaceae bacterium]